MNRCYECKYFKKLDDDSWNKKKYQNTYGECDNKKFEYKDDFDYNKRKETDKLLYQDYEGYSAYFLVGCNFGCIHWEEKCKNIGQ